MWEYECSLGKGPFGFFRRKNQYLWEKIDRKLWRKSKSDDQHKSRGSHWRILVIKIQGSCDNQKREYLLFKSIVLVFNSVWEVINIFIFRAWLLRVGVDQTTFKISCVIYLCVAYFDCFNFPTLKLFTHPTIATVQLWCWVLL